MVKQNTYHLHSTQKTKVLLTAVVLLLVSTAFSQNSGHKKMEKQINSKTIVFIHGLFMNNQTWDKWKTLFKSEGYTCYAPAHPKHTGNPTDLRANPPEGLEKVQFVDWITKLEKFIDALPEKPILIGHSFGGLTAQKLVESGRAEAAILISSAPPKGNITFKPSFFKANNPVISPFKGKSVYNPKEEKYKKWFHSSIANSLTKEESDALFDQFVVPESRETPRASLRKITKIDTQKPHVPMLFLGGLEDVIVPNVLVKKNIKSYTDQNSIVDFKFYEDKDHMICATSGWEDVAYYSLNWLKN